MSTEDDAATRAGADRTVAGRAAKATSPVASGAPETVAGARADAAPTAGGRRKPPTSLMVGGGGLALLVAFVAIALATGVFSGDEAGGGSGETPTEATPTEQAGEPEPEEPEGPLAGIEFTKLDADDFTATVPQGWALTVGPQRPTGRPQGSRLETKVEQPEGNIRLTLNRRPDQDFTAEAQAEQARDELFAREGPNPAGYREIRYGPVSFASRDAFVWEFVKNDPELGRRTHAISFFRLIGGDSFRIQGNSRQGEVNRATSSAVTRRAARTVKLK